MGVNAPEPDWVAVERQQTEARRRRQAAAADPTTPAKAQAIAQSAHENYWMPAGFHVGVATAGMPSWVANQVAAITANKLAGGNDLVPENKHKKGYFDHVGDVVGGVTKGVSNIVKPIGRVGAEAIDFVVPEGVENAIGSAPVKGVARSTLSAFEAPYQEGVGVVRNVAALATNTLTGAGGGGQRGANTTQNLQAVTKGVNFANSQSDFGVAVGDVVSGRVSAKEMFLGETKERPKIDPETGQPMVDAAGQPVMESYSRSLGTGFLPDKEAGAPQEAAQRARDVLSIGGQAWTPGRAVASMIVEPGTDWYNAISGVTDAGVATWFDPTNRAFDFITEGRRARDAFELYGLIGASRKTALPEVADAWLNSSEGLKKVVGFAEEGDWTKIWRRFDRQIDPELATSLANATTPADVIDILRPEIGVTLRSRSQIPQLGSRVDAMGGAWVRSWRDSQRFLGDVPIHESWVDDRIGTLKAMDDSMRNIGMSDTARDAALYDFGQSLLDPRNTTKTAQAIKGVEKAMAAHLEHYLNNDTAVKLSLGKIKSNSDWAAQRSKEMTNIISASYEEMHRYAQTEMGQNMRVPFLNIGGQPVELVGPHLLSEQLARRIEYPDPRELKRAANHMNALYENGAWTGAVDGIEKVQRAWKKWVLLRGAYVVRVIADEQARMAADGLTSMFDHPLSWISYVAGEEEGRLGDVLRKIGVKPRGAEDALGNSFDIHDMATEFGQAIGNRAKIGAADDASYMSNYRRHVEINSWYNTNRDAADYASAWGNELARLRTDEVMNKVASGQPLNEVQDWLWDNQTIRDRLTDMYADRGADFSSRQVSDGFVESVVERWRAASSSEPSLTAAMETNLLPSGKAAFEYGMPTPALKQHLQGLADSGVGPEHIRTRGAYTEKVKNSRFSSVDWLFQALAGKPTAYLSRSPTFRQRYWERMAYLASTMDDPSRNRLLIQAEQQIKPSGPKGLRTLFDHVTGREVDIYDDLIGNVQFPAGTLTLEQADDAAKMWALNQTKELLYDTTRRSQWADTLRVISPFAEAWKEQITVWGGLFKDPSNIRRAQQLVQGARGSGFFYQDEATGQEVFNYPMTGRLAQVFAGVNVPMRGSVQGLSLMGSIQPGLGPVMSVGVGKLLPDIPEMDAVSNFLMPFGEPDIERGFLEGQLMPTWVRNAYTGLTADPERNRAFGNTVGDVMGVLASTGEYGTSVSERDRLYNDAVPKARILYMMRAFGPLMGAPSAPQFNPKVTTPEGVDVATSMMVQDYYKMQQDDYETAIPRFMAKYGDDAFVFMATKSLSTVGGQQASTEYGKWERDNSDVVSKYPEIAGYFGPDVEGFDFSVYNRQFASGRRESRTPKERYEAGQALVASFIYRQRRDSLSDNPSKEQRAWLRSWKTELLDEYPGWNPEGFINDRPEAMRQTYEAAADPKVKDTPAGQALQTYLDRRDAALAQLEGRGLVADKDAFSQAKSAAGLRSWLYTWGSELAKETPEFARLWDQVLAPEVDDSVAVDDPEEVAPSGSR